MHLAVISVRDFNAIRHDLMDITWGAVLFTASITLSTLSLHHLDGCSDHRPFGS
jgi:hypothetical protein